MDCAFSFLILLLSVIGIATVIRYIVWKITDSKQTEYHYMVFLEDNNAEILLRGIIERDYFDISGGCRKLYAINMGLEESAVSACKKLAEDYSQIVFCQPCELADYLKK